MNEQNMSEKELQKQRNIANNANNIRVAADIASKTNNPYAKAIGTAVKTADKITGGKSSEKLGKAVNLANKITPGGRLAQKAMNKMSESGTSKRIGQAVNKKNNSSVGANSRMKSNAVAEGKDDSELDTREVEDETSDGGEVNVKTSAKMMKTIIFAMPLVLILLVFMNLMTAGSQTYLSVTGLDQADKVSSADAEKKISEKDPAEFDKEIKDDTAYNFNDIFIEDNVYSKKLNNLNFISKTTSREYSEADLSELEDFYSDINSYEGYDMDTVYKFFFKLLYIQRRYKNSYGVNLDMALIMSVLSVQSENKNDVFIENTKDYKVTPKENNEHFDYYYDWSNYKSTKSDSSHDIEILAHNMVTKTSDSGCSTIDGACYKIVDESQYREFLKEFIERKYYTEEGYIQNTVVVPNKDPNASPNTPAQGDFTTWKQCDPRWGTMKVPTSNDTLCDIGCLVTSVSIQIARSKTIITTETLDPGIALQNFSFIDNGNLVYASINNLAPNFVYLTTIQLVGMDKKSIADKLLSYDSTRYYIVLGVGKTYHNHYVALDYIDKNTNNVYMLDPGSSTQTSDLYSVYKLYEALIFEKKD